MTPRDPCERFTRAILEPDTLPAGALDRHLAACPGCRGLEAAHRAASRLPRVPVPAAPPWPLEAIVARVRRRRRARAALGAAAAAGAALVLAVVRSPRPSAPAAGDDLFAVADAVAAYVQRDVAGGDPVLGPLAPVAGWFAAPLRQPLDLSSFAPSPRTAGGESP